MVYSCKQTKYVPEGKYLLAKNSFVVYDNKLLSVSEIANVAKQKPNSRAVFKFKLGFFNMMDSTKVANKRLKKNLKLQSINQKRLDKQDKVNNRRRDKAIKKGKIYYKNKDISLKDTLNPKKIFSEWVKYTLGEPPSILDTALTQRTQTQLALYLQKKGYFYGYIRDTTFYDSIKRKAKVLYRISPGRPYTIDSVYVDIETAKDTQWGLRDWLGGEETASNDATEFYRGAVLDSDLLNRERNFMTKYMREQGFYGFYPEHIYYELDTFQIDFTAHVAIKVKPRIVKNEQYPDSANFKEHGIFHMRQVFFHMYEPNPLGGEVDVDTLIYKVEEKKRDPYEIVFFIEKNLSEKKRKKYTKPYIKPKLIAYQNFLEPKNYYKSYYAERTYRRIQALGVFRSVNLKLLEIGEDSLDAHFYLLKGKRQTFKIEPRGTYSNGFIGLSATIGYTNKNLFRGAEKFTFNIVGGFESQPTIIDDGTEGRIFNTWEIGPTMSLEVPGLLPIPYLSFGKRTFPITIYSIAYNHQVRPDFKRDLFQISWLYRWSPSDPKQMFNSGFPLINSIKYVQIDKSPEFEQRLIELNDLFLLSSYSDQFIWEDFRLGWTFNNNKLTKSKLKTYYNIGFVTAGYFLEGVKKLDYKVKGVEPDTISKLFGVPFSKFLRFDNEVRLYHEFRKGMSMNYRVMGGVGWPDPGGGVLKALPYDYSFYAGGASDNRGWVSRTLGPGSYKYYLDTNSTQTQIGDVRLLLQIEYRFDIYSFIKGALFTDASNVWTFYDDPNRVGGQFGKNFIKEFAINVGVGLRFDFDFFQIRFDLGFPIHEPSMPTGERWIFSNQSEYATLMEDVYGSDWQQVRKDRNIRKPFIPRFNIGIGYPF